MQRKRAFTLIELLVVIAIIAILAAILFPVFAKARESAKKTKSLNNIKQLATAVTMYSQDYNETFPGWAQATATTYAHNVWDEQINSQVKAKGAFTNGDTGIRSYSQPSNVTHDRVLTYGLNGLLIAPSATFNGNADFGALPAPSSPGAVGNPAGTILFAELATGAGLGGQPNPLMFGANATGTGTSEWTSAVVGWIDINPRAFIEQVNNLANNAYVEPYGSNANSGVARDLYSGGGVYAFCDGHAKFMKVGVSVGMGTTIGTTVITTPAQIWNPGNTNNMWNPQ